MHAYHKPSLLDKTDNFSCSHKSCSPLPNTSAPVLSHSRTLYFLTPLSN